MSPSNRRTTVCQSIGRTGKSLEKALILLGLASLWIPAMANGIGQNSSWDFTSSNDKAIRNSALETVERKRSGYYDAVKPVYNTTNVTNIQRQYNCSVSANSAGNSGSNSTTASTASPNLASSGSTSSSTLANSATNGFSPAGFGNPVSTGPSGLTPQGTLSNSQSNTGSLSAGVTGSTTQVSGGTSIIGSGRTDQALNSRQSNTGNLAASVSGSNACAGV